MGRQGIFNYWDFPSKISRKCHKKLAPEKTLDQWEMFVKLSLRDWLVCFADFVGMTILACLPYAFYSQPIVPSRLLLPPLNCFLRVCLPTVFAAVQNFFLPIKTTAISDAAKSNTSAPARFATGTTCSPKNGVAVLPISCASAPNPLPCCWPKPPQIGNSNSFEATTVNCFFR